MTTPLAETKAAFMSSLHFAVIGASKDQNKVGTKVRFVVMDTDYMRFLNAAFNTVDSEVVPD